MADKVETNAPQLEQKVSVWGELPYKVKGVDYGTAKIAVSFSAQILNDSYRQSAVDLFTDLKHALLADFKDVLESETSAIVDELVKKQMKSTIDEYEAKLKIAREEYIKLRQQLK
jgi:hypothetical protein